MMFMLEIPIPTRVDLAKLGAVTSRLKPLGTPEIVIDAAELENCKIRVGFALQATDLFEQGYELCETMVVVNEILTTEGWGRKICRNDIRRL